MIIDLQGKPEITTGMEKLNIAEKTSKQSKTQVTDFQNKQKEVERLKMSLHGFLSDWEEEFESASDQTDFEELLRSLRSPMADQALERFKAAWGETADSATKLGEVTSSQGEAQAIVNWAFMEGKRQVAIFRNKRKAMIRETDRLASKLEPKTDQTVDTGHRDL